MGAADPFGYASLTPRVSLIPSAADASGAPINRIRATTTRVADGQPIHETDVDVSSGAQSWEIDLRVPASPTTTDVVVVVLLLHVASDATESVEFSGRTPVIPLTAGQTVAPALDIVRGPVENLETTSVTITASPASLIVGDTATLSANAMSSGSTPPTVFWTSLDSSVVGVVGGRAVGRAPGSASIVASAGAFADTIPIAVHSLLGITTTSLPGGVQGVPYTQPLAAAGGAGPYAWSMASGLLPAGLALALDGTLSGIPTAATSSNFTVEVTSADGQTAQRSLSITVHTLLGITTTSLPRGVEGLAYSQSLTATGGAGPYDWRMASGSLPAGLSLASDGTLSGIPTAAGSSSFTAEVTSADLQTAISTLTLDIDFPPLVIATPALPGAVPGTAYSAVLLAAGGGGGYDWQVTAGGLPSGIALDPLAGELSGTPSALGSETFTVTVTSLDGQTQSRVYTLWVGNLLGRWVDGSGSPIAGVASVGSTVSLQICYAGSDMAAFQATIGAFASLAQATSVSSLDSSAASVHPDCMSLSDVLESGFTASGLADPITLLVVSSAASGGSGPTGVATLSFDLTAAGLLELQLGSIVSSDFGGSAITLAPSIDPLTVN